MRNFYWAISFVLLTIYTTSINSQEWKEIKLIDPPRVIKLANFTDTDFNDSADFRRTTFISEANFLGAHFASRADFATATFNTTVDFEYSRFASYANFEGATFNGFTTFSRSEFDSTTIFEFSYFAFVADFSDAVFNSITNFSYMTFDYGANFSQVQFSTVDFHNSKHLRSTTFNNSEFKSRTSFRGARFTITEFMSAHFDSIADFSYTHMSFGDFREVHFDTNIYFSNAHLKAWFNSAKFGDQVDFSEAYLGEVDFSDAKFETGVNFSRTKFESYVLFVRTILPTFLDFSYTTRIEHELDLTEALINPSIDLCNINLLGASIDKIKFRYKRFKLWFPEGDSIGYEMKANVYEELLKKQKEEGFNQSYEILDKEYKEFQYTDPKSQYGWSWGHILNWVEKNWWGYGYNKELIIRNVILIYLFFSIINVFFLKYLVNNVYTIDRIKNWTNNLSGSTTGKLLKSIPFSMFYTALIFFGFKFDIEKLNYDANLLDWKIINIVYFFIIYLGGFVCMAYLANYIITV